MAPDPHTDSFPSLKCAYLPIAAIKKQTNKQPNNQSNNKDTKNDENKKTKKNTQN